MTTSAMHIDPERLREFAGQLNSTLTFYRKSIEELDARLQRLGETWRDQDFLVFSRELKVTKRILEDFIKEGEEARRRLLEDAQLAEDYQRINIP